MTLLQTNFTVTLTHINCGQCGGTYAINEQYRAQAAVEGSLWNCPYCKVQWGYGRDNENSRLKKQLAHETKLKEWAQTEARHKSELAEQWRRKEQAQRAAKTKIRKRVGNGVCPCCNRTFSNLQRHMAGQHPAFAG